MKNEVSEKTYTMYLSTLNAMAKKMGYDSTPDDKGKWIEKHYDDLIKHIDSLTSLHTRKNKITVLLVFAQTFDLKKSIIDDLTKRMDALAGKVKSNYEKNEMNEKQKENWVSVADIDAKINELKNAIPKTPTERNYKDYYAVIRYLILLIHRNAPLRNDLADCQIYTDKPADMSADVNYLIVPKKGNAYLIMNNFKTKEIYKTNKKINFSPLITSELRKYMPLILSISSNHWLLVEKSNHDKPLSRNAFTKFFNKIFAPKKVSTTMIRHSVVSELYQVNADEYKDKQQLADVMQHSVNTAGLIYAKDLKDVK